ncbi:MAG: hypothetical protein WCW52_01350 [Elusimicrobiales bacterium]
MKFLNFKEKLKGFDVFGLADVRKIAPDFDFRRINEWMAKGYINKVRRGYYIFSDAGLDEHELFLIANTIYKPSYISLEMALSLYGLIPEAVYAITSVTSQKTNQFKTNIGVFTYKQLKPSLMFGYELREKNGRRVLVAEIEKALLDFLYLNPRIKDAVDFESLRFNSAEFKAKADTSRLNKYLDAFGVRALSSRVGRFLDL